MFTCRHFSKARAISTLASFNSECSASTLFFNIGMSSSLQCSDSFQSTALWKVSRVSKGNSRCSSPMKIEGFNSRPSLSLCAKLITTLLRARVAAM
jgi:hypothetical protein